MINLPQDAVSFASSLPRSSSALDVIVVRKEGINKPHRDFRVRRSVVHHALQWLIENNIYYRANRIHIDMNAVSQLPLDGNLKDLKTIVAEKPAEIDQHVEAAEDSELSNEMHQSFVPITVESVTEQENIRRSFEQPQSNQSASLSSTPISWPLVLGTPVNEFTTEGYFSCAFPTLFPTGAADFLGQRQRRITVGKYFKHLMMYHDGRFAKHPRFRFFALNTEMRWRALQLGRIYVKQHPGDAQLSLDELRDMVGREGLTLTNRVLHYATSLRGTKQYWFKQRGRLVSMIDTLGLPTIFFTHSSADLQWPGLARLLCPEECESRSSRSKAVINNPAISDWFFYHRVVKYFQVFYVDILGATDYWMRFEWQHRGSPHVHVLVWFPNATDVKKLLCADNLYAAEKEIVQYADTIVTTMNPAVLPDRSNIQGAPAPKTHPHVCNKAYGEIKDFDQNLKDLVATCQLHTRCSTA